MTTGIVIFLELTWWQAQCPLPHCVVCGEHLNYKLRFRIGAIQVAFIFLNELKDLIVVQDTDIHLSLFIFASDMEWHVLSRSNFSTPSVATGAEAEPLRSHRQLTPHLAQGMLLDRRREGKRNPRPLSSDQLQQLRALLRVLGQG